MKLTDYMRTQEARHLWSLRWVIFGQFCAAGFALTVALDATSKWSAPPWLWWLFVVGFLWVALLATVAKAVNPPGGHLGLPLGDAVLPAMPTVQLRGSAPQPAPQAPPAPAPVLADPTPAPTFAWGSPGATARETAHRLAAHYTGLDLTARQDGGVWRLGYGHAFGIAEGMTCTRAQAHAWLGADMESAFTVLDLWVTVPLTANQRAALVDFVFAVGPGAEGDKDGFVWLASGEHSALYIKLQAGDYAGASAEFGAWNTCNGVVLDGLTERRASERELFDTP